jgi:hypothetical protein
MSNDSIFCICGAAVICIFVICATNVIPDTIRAFKNKD